MFLVLIVVSASCPFQVCASFFQCCSKSRGEVQHFRICKENRILKYLSGYPNLHVFSLTDLMPQVKVQAVETVEGCTHEVSAVKMHMTSIGLFNRITCITASLIIQFIVLVFTISQNHLGWKKTCKLTESNHKLNTAKSTTKTFPYAPHLHVF